MGTPKSRPRFPWKKLAAAPRSFIKSRYMEDNIVALLKELSEMLVQDCVRVFDYIYRLQGPGREDLDEEDELVFEISHFVNPRDDDELLPRVPREYFEEEFDPFGDVTQFAYQLKPAEFGNYHLDSAENQKGAKKGETWSKEVKKMGKAEKTGGKAEKGKGKAEKRTGKEKEKGKEKVGKGKEKEKAARDQGFIASNDEESPRGDFEEEEDQEEEEEEEEDDEESEESDDFSEDQGARLFDSEEEESEEELDENLSQDQEAGTMEGDFSDHLPQPSGSPPTRKRIFRMIESSDSEEEVVQGRKSPPKSPTPLQSPLPKPTPVSVFTGVRTRNQRQTRQKVTFIPESASQVLGNAKRTAQEVPLDDPPVKRGGRQRTASPQKPATKVIPSPKKPKGKANIAPKKPALNAAAKKAAAKKAAQREAATKKAAANKPPKAKEPPTSPKKRRSSPVKRRR
jgi:hypothetical protein